MSKSMSRDTAATLGGVLTLAGGALLLTIFFRIENSGLAMMLVISTGLLVIGTGITTDVRVRRQLQDDGPPNVDCGQPEQHGGDLPSSPVG